MDEATVAMGLARVLRYWDHGLLYGDDTGDSRVAEVVEYPDAGMPRCDQGVVLRLRNGEEYLVSVTRSK